MDEQVQRALSLYDQCRYVDAWRLYEPLFSAQGEGDASPALLATLGRVALRLGDMEAGLRMVRVATEKDPLDPVVRHFHQMLLNEESVLGYWKKAAADSRDDVHPDFLASVSGSRAIFLANLKDFERAWHCIRTGRSTGRDGAWLDCASAWILMSGESWAEAWEAALEAWKGRPNYPLTAEILFNLAPRLGRTGELLELFLAGAATCQSFETALTMHRLGMALAFTEGGDRDPRALDLAAKGLGLAESMATMAGDLFRDHIQDRRRSLEAMVNGPRPLVLPCRRVYQNRDTCVPASLCTIASLWDPAMDLGDLARRMTMTGTETFTAVRVMGELGYRTRLFELDRDTAVGLVKHGLPFMVILRNDAGGHAMAALGLDNDDAVLLVHDPNQLELVRLPLVDLKDAGPFGVLAMAVVPGSMDLPDLAYPRSAEVEAYFRCLSLMSGVELAPLRQVLASLEPGGPPSPWHIRSQALLAQMEGRYEDERDMLLALHREYPAAPELEGMVVDAMGRCRDQAGFHRWLEQASRAERPGFMVRLRLADVLAGQSATAPGAEALVQALLKENPSSAMAWAAFARLAGHDGRTGEADCAWEIAARLEPRNEGLAQAYASVLARTRGEEQAFEWLAARAESLAGAWQGDLAFMTLLDSPLCPAGSRRNRSVLARGLELWPDSPSLRERQAVLLMEDQDGAGLEAVLDKGAGRHLLAGPGVRLQLALRNGHPDRAGRVRELKDLRPDLPWVWEHGLRLALAEGGREAGRAFVAETRARLAQFPPVDQWAVQTLREHELHDDADTLVADILTGDPDNGFALRDRAFRYIAKYPDTMPPGALAAFSTLVRHLDVQNPHEAAHRMLNLELVRYREGCLVSWARSVRDLVKGEPGYGYGLSRLLDTIEALEKDQVADILPSMLAFVGKCPEASWAAQRVLLLAGQYGLAGEARSLAAEWLGGGNPRLAQAALEAATVRPDLVASWQWAPRVVSMAREDAGDWALCLAAGRYLAAAGCDHDARDILKATIRRYPLYFPARTSLAEILHGLEDRSGAVRVLEEGLGIGILTQEVVMDYVRALDSCGEPVKALRVLETLPGRSADAAIMGLRIQLLTRLRRTGEARETSRLLEEAFPDAPALVEDRIRSGLQGGTMDKEEAVAWLRVLLETGPDRYDTADLLAVALHGNGQSIEALDVLGHFRDGFNRVPALGRQLWVEHSGKDPLEVVRAWVALLARFPAYEWGWSTLASTLASMVDPAAKSAALVEVLPLLSGSSHRIPAVLGEEFRRDQNQETLGQELERIIQENPHDSTLVWIWYLNARELDLAHAPDMLAGLLARLEGIHGREVIGDLPASRCLGVYRFLQDPDADKDPAWRFLDLPETVRRPWEWELWTRMEDRFNQGYVHAYLERVFAGKVSYGSFDLFLSFKFRNLGPSMEKWKSRPPVLYKTSFYYWTGVLGRALCLSGDASGEPGLYAMASRAADYLANEKLERDRYHSMVARWRDKEHLWAEYNFWYSAKSYPRLWRYLFSRTLRDRPKVFMWNACNLVTTLTRHHPVNLAAGPGFRRKILAWAVEHLVPDHTFRFMATLHADELLRHRRYGEFRNFCARHAGTWDDETRQEGEYWGPGLSWEGSWGLRHLCRAVACTGPLEGLAAHEATRTIAPSMFWHEAALFPDQKKILKPVWKRLLRVLGGLGSGAGKALAGLVFLVWMGNVVLNTVMGPVLLLILVIAGLVMWWRNMKQ